MAIFDIEKNERQNPGIVKLRNFLRNIRAFSWAQRRSGRKACVKGTFRIERCWFTCQTKQSDKTKQEWKSFRHKNSAQSEKRLHGYHQTRCRSKSQEHSSSCTLPFSHVIAVGLDQAADAFEGFEAVQMHQVYRLFGCETFQGRASIQNVRSFDAAK